MAVVPFLRPSQMCTVLNVAFRFTGQINIRITSHKIFDLFISYFNKFSFSPSHIIIDSIKAQ